MKIADKLIQIQKDLDYITKTYGSVDERSEMVEVNYPRLLANPSKKTAFELQYEELYTLFNDGYVHNVGTLGHIVMKPLPLMEDENIKEIYLRYTTLPMPEDADLD